MSDSAGMNDHHDLFEGGESKSSSSQESGLCSTMLAIDESMGSLEEISENLHQNLDAHLDHTSLLHYELDLLRSQLAEKNRLITTQQLTIKQLQEALNATQKEMGEIRKAAEMEITCKSETIDILQSDLVDSQQQYASCLQQVMHQNRLLSDIQDDDAVLIQKIAHLETKLCKTSQTVATQTDNRVQHHIYNDNTQSVSHNSLKISNSFSPFLSSRQRDYEASSRHLLRSFHDEASGNHAPNNSSPFNAAQSSSPPQKRQFLNAKCETKLPESPQFQELLSEIRQIQKLLESTRERPGRETSSTYQGNSSTIQNENLAEFWNTITEERQHRLELDHLIRQMELDVLEVKTQVQSCKARFQLEQPPSQAHWSCCSTKHCCTGTQNHGTINSCCTCGEDTRPLPPYTKPRSTSSFYTLV